MKKLNFTFLALLMTCIVYSCSNSPKKTKDTNTTAGDSLPGYHSDTSLKNPADTAVNVSTTFALKAAAGGTMEVMLGNIAQQNAHSLRVKKFGAMMVKDHTKANKELMALADSKNILIPSKLPDAIQNHIDQINKYKGADFDKHYMEMMVDDHKEDIDLFSKKAKDQKDTTFKAFASKTLPVLNMHLDSAKAIKKDIK